MKFSRGLLLLLVLWLAIPIACGDDDGSNVITQTPAVNPDQLIGRPLPEAAGEDLIGTGSARLSSFKGSVLVVAFWLNACPDCQKVMPELQALSDRLRGVKFVSVAIDDKDANGNGPKGYETPKAFIKTAGLTMPTILVSRASADASFNLYRIPTVILVDSAGLVARTFVWPFTTAEVEAAAAGLK